VYRQPLMSAAGHPAPDLTPRECFERDGYFVCRGVLSPARVAELTAASDALLAEQSPAHFKDHVTSGSMVMVDWQLFNRHPAFAELVVDRGVVAALASLGFTQPKFGHGRVISKPPHSPQLDWHRDGRYWNDPTTRTPQPRQVFLMFYLVDTTPANGCLRVVPKSHLQKHPIDDLLQRSASTRLFQNPEYPGFGHAEGEVDVPLRAGDFVAGYAELLHSAHANSSDKRRTCLTMWYYPDFVNLPERSRATIMRAETEPDKGGNQLASLRVPELAKKLAPFEIVYDGQEQPYESSGKVPFALPARL
jgi:ectoine hydroxylase-related dioxygenase (phytanoyl-CoA dioxygenase family)